MVRAAAGYLVRNGPVTPQDRWEETAGYTPFTLAAEIAALLVAADWAERCGEPALAPYLRDTADSWNAQIEHWLYVRDTPLARRCGVEGYYVRIAETISTMAMTTSISAIARWPIRAGVPMRSSRPMRWRWYASGCAQRMTRASSNTVKVIDAMLKTQLPMGPGWHRYTDDGYGEHADGSPFDGTGIGRVWPLLSGERAHYALARGDVATARALLASFEAMAGEGGLLPEQSWDAADSPDRELFLGRPAGSAMPLVWAHAEYLKLVHSLADGRVFDMPPQTHERYVRRRTKSSALRIWRFNQKLPLACGVPACCASKPCAGPCALLAQMPGTPWRVLSTQATAIGRAFPRSADREPRRWHKGDFYIPTGPRRIIGKDSDFSVLVADA